MQAGTIPAEETATKRARRQTSKHDPSTVATPSLGPRKPVEVDPAALEAGGPCQRNHWCPKANRHRGSCAKPVVTRHLRRSLSVLTPRGS